MSCRLNRVGVSKNCHLSDYIFPGNELGTDEQDVKYSNRGKSTNFQRNEWMVRSLPVINGEPLPHKTSLKRSDCRFPCYGRSVNNVELSCGTQET